MKEFKTKVECSDSDKEYYFECYENDVPIEIGDKYIFFFAGIADVQICDNEKIKYEINKNEKSKKTDCIDLVYNFWTKCYKIKLTNLDLRLVD